MPNVFSYEKGRKGMTDARQKKAITKLIRKEIHRNIEDKFLDVYVPRFDVYSDTNANLGYFNCLNSLITAGALHNQRIGVKIKPKYLTIRGYVQGPSGATADASVFRCVVFCWKTSNGAAPINTQLFLPVAGATSINTPWATYNRNYIPQDIKILYDKRINLNLENGPGLTANTVGSKATFVAKIPLFKRTGMVQYNNGVTGTFADITKNSFWLYATTDQNSAGLRNVGFSYNYTFEYEDA